MKAGGLAAFGCGVLGFTGGTVLKRKEELAEEASHLDEPARQDEEIEPESDTEPGQNKAIGGRRVEDPYKED